ncbi:hypothetical protein V9K67_10460 [Paraflavisolibacter sp. H34]|uniref:hypothetical protein n=1 Tax=Huijunlia imazamoxiresistens TaxID=3127457 RepID=UPI003017295F
MNKPFFMFLCLLWAVGFSSVQAQEPPVIQDSLVQVNPVFAVNRYYELLKNHDPISYLAYPHITPLVKRQRELQNGEGKNGYWFEGHLTNRFTIYRGKYYSRPFFQRLRFTFDVGMMPRLTRDTSNPLLPYNNRFGLGLDFSLNRVSNQPVAARGRLWTTLQLHHLSNGQADSFFVAGNGKRNNYRGGDFSTNYYRVLLNYARLVGRRSLVSSGLGYQQEINIGGPLLLSPELKGYYGLQRLLFHFQWMRPSRLTTQTYRNLSSPQKDSVRILRRRRLACRTELEYIRDDLSLFPGNRKYRLAGHQYLTYMPSVSNDLGFLLHLYAGRDYLNIRFDDVVFIAQAGVFVRIR